MRTKADCASKYPINLGSYCDRHIFTSRVENVVDLQCLKAGFIQFRHGRDLRCLLSMCEVPGSTLSEIPIFSSVSFLSVILSLIGHRFMISHFILKSPFFEHTVKPDLRGHSKRRPKLVFKTDYHLMQVKSIAECSKRAFCNTFDLHKGTICL